MKRVLYVTPYFPPLSRVGALDPLKMARALPGHGWEPIVLSDQWPGAPTNPDLLHALPENLIVHREFSGRPSVGVPAAQSQSPRDTGPLGRFIKAVVDGREWLPMGEMGRYMAHAAERATELIRRYGCEAVLAQATPAASLPAARQAASAAGLPLVCILGDPWGPCELKRPKRPFYTRMIEDRYEREVLRAASRIVLYTEQAREDYIRFYPDLPAERFAAIDNGPDEAIFTESWDGSFAKPTLLYFGSFSEDMHPTPIVRLLAELKSRGGLAADAVCASTAPFPYGDMTLARKLGIAERIVSMPRVSYRQALSVMQAADILLAIVVTPQRISAKVYDYLASDRPVLVISPPHSQIDAILSRTNAGIRISPDDIEAMADFVAKHLQGGRHPRLERNRQALQALHFDAAARDVAGFLDQAVTDQTRHRFGTACR